MTCPTLTWTSTDETVGMITSAGVFTASAAGATTITASADTIESNAATVTVSAAAPTLTSITISPTSCDLDLGGTQAFAAVCTDTSGSVMTCPTLTWTCDSSAVGTIDSSGLFTAGGVGTTTVTASAEGKTSNAATVTVSAPTETVPVDGTDFPETPVPAGTAATITVDGTFDHDVTGSIDMTPVADPEETVGSYAFTGDDEALMGLTMTPDAAVIAELADGNDTIRIEICYSATELASKGIDPSTLAIHRYDVAAAAWVKMVAGTDPCVANGITGTCAWITVNDLSTFALVGTKTAAPSGVGGGDGGTYPPEWDPTPELWRQQSQMLWRQQRHQPSLWKPRPRSQAYQALRRYSQSQGCLQSLMC
jgi:hypothetical protein